MHFYFYFLNTTHFWVFIQSRLVFACLWSVGLPEASLFCLFFKDFMFWSSFKFTAKLMERCRNFPHTPPIFTHAQPPKLATSPSQSDAFATFDDLTLTHHNHPKTMDCSRVHSHCHTSCGFGRVCKDLCPPLQYHTQHFHSLELPASHPW